MVLVLYFRMDQYIRWKKNKKYGTNVFQYGSVYKDSSLIKNNLNMIFGSVAKLQECSDYRVKK